MVLMDSSISKSCLPYCLHTLKRLPEGVRVPRSLATRSLSPSHALKYPRSRHFKPMDEHDKGNLLPRIGMEREYISWRRSHRQITISTPSAMTPGSQVGMDRTAPQWLGRFEAADRTG